MFSKNTFSVHSTSLSRLHDALAYTTKRPKREIKESFHFLTAT